MLMSNTVKAARLRREKIDAQRTPAAANAR
jgi:hypothetical protein